MQKLSSPNTIKTLLANTPVMPILTIHDLNAAAPLARTLFEAGIQVVEVTLRTPVALDVIQAMKATVPQLKIGAGTILKPSQFKAIIAAGADFAVSPGFTGELGEAALSNRVPYLPGITTPSEAMIAKGFGFNTLKFFPAESAGGTATLTAMQSVFPDLQFVATGQITPDNMARYLALKNVLAVGASWIATTARIEQHDWNSIARDARDIAKRPITSNPVA